MASISWFGGYLSVTGVISSSTNPRGDREKVISPPRLLFYFCGAPKSNKYPEGAMGESAFRAQMMGIGLGIFTIVINIWQLSKPEFIIGFGLSAVLPLLIWAYVSRYYVIRVQSTNRKRNK